jgi:hypothetical protein
MSAAECIASSSWMLSLFVREIPAAFIAKVVSGSTCLYIVSRHRPSPHKNPCCLASAADQSLLLFHKSSERAVPSHTYIGLYFLGTPFKKFGDLDCYRERERQRVWSLLAWEFQNAKTQTK